MTLAEKLGGVVVNADSMQVYRDLRVITARPSPADEARVPHRLYGHVDAAENYSAGRWCRDVGAVLAEAAQQGALPSWSAAPGFISRRLPMDWRRCRRRRPRSASAVRRRLVREGAAAQHAELPPRSRHGAKADGQRPFDIARALEVIEETGRPLSRMIATGSRL